MVDSPPEKVDNPEIVDLAILVCEKTRLKSDSDRMK